MLFKEIETKYDAANIKQADFLKIVDEHLIVVKKLLVSSYDDYYTNSAGEFIRYRYTDNRGELTIKRKTKDSNNLERVEVNIPTAGDAKKEVSAFVDLLGYEHNFCVYKTCNIFWTSTINVVYYVVYDEEFREQRRFIEIEANEDVEWENEDAAWEEIVKFEKLLEPLGITAKNRLRKSLFEIFRKP